MKEIRKRGRMEGEAKKAIRACRLHLRAVLGASTFPSRLATAAQKFNKTDRRFLRCALPKTKKTRLGSVQNASRHNHFGNYSTSDARTKCTQTHTVLLVLFNHLPFRHSYLTHHHFWGSCYWGCRQNTRLFCSSGIQRERDIRSIIIVQFFVISPRRLLLFNSIFLLY